MRLRPALPQEMPFVWSSWAKGDHRSWSSALGRDLGEAYHRLVEDLATPTTTLVAEAADGLLDGCAVYELPDILHLVYVRHSGRRQGVARALVNALPLRRPLRYTCEVPAWMQAKVPADWRYAPRLLMRGNHGQREARRLPETR